jgi:hypothetical protein
MPGWLQTRVGLVLRSLRAKNLAAVGVAFTRSAVVETVAPLLDRLRPRLIINRGFLLPPEVVDQLNRRFPRTRIVSVNHGSYADLARLPRWLKQLRGYVELAGERKNCWYGAVDERNQAAQLGHRRCIWMPNVVHDPLAGDDPPPEVARKPARLSLICHPRAMKNLSGQILAAGMIAGRRSGAELVVSSPKIADSGLENLRPLVPQLSWRHLAWADWETYTANVRRYVDVGLQASFTESFNYVGLEHLLCSKPVAGSPALRYLPPDWQANPDDPGAIAAVIDAHLDDYPVRAARARRAGLMTMHLWNNAFDAAIERLLD